MTGRTGLQRSSGYGASPLFQSTLWEYHSHQCSTDELFKASAYLTDCYLPSPSSGSGNTKGRDEKNANASEGVTDEPTPDPTHPMHAPFNLAFRTGTPYFEWLERPQNAARLRRFGRAMTGTGAWEVPGAVIGGGYMRPNLCVCVGVGVLWGACALF